MGNSPSTLAQCLQTIEEGEGTPAECLARYPKHRDELESLLETVTLLRAAPEISPRPTFRRVACRRLLSQLVERRPATFWDRLAARWEHGRQALYARRLATVLTVVLALGALLLGGGRAVSASGKALPGDTLYPVKAAVEDVRLALAGDESAFRLYLEFAEARIDEMERLSAEARFEDVPVAASRFGRQMQGAVGVATELGAQDAERSKALAEELDASLVAHRTSLYRLLETAPVSVRPAVERALEDTDDGPEEEGEDPSIGDSDRRGAQEGDADSAAADVDETRDDDSSRDRGDEPGPEEDADGSTSDGDTDDEPGGSSDNGAGLAEDLEDGTEDEGGIDPGEEVSDTSGDETDDDADEPSEPASTGPSERDDTEGEAGSGGERIDGADESSEDRSRGDSDQENAEHADLGDDSSDSSDDDSRSSSDDRSSDSPDDDHRADGESSDSSDSSPGRSDDHDNGDSGSDDGSNSGESHRSEHESQNDSEDDSDDGEERD
jgi:hypothetical protein